MQNQPIFKKPTMPTTTKAPSGNGVINSAANTLFRDVNQPINNMVTPQRQQVLVFSNNPATPRPQNQPVFNNNAAAMQSQHVFNNPATPQRQQVFSNNPATPRPQNQTVFNNNAVAMQSQQVFNDNLPVTPQRQPMFKKPATPRPQNQPINNNNMATMQHQPVFNNAATMQNQPMFNNMAAMQMQSQPIFNNPANPQRQHVFNNNMVAMQSQPVFKKPTMPMPPTKAPSSRSVVNHAAITLLKSAHVMDAIQSRNSQKYQQATKFVKESADLSLGLKLLSRNFHSQCLERYNLEKNLPDHQKLIERGMEAAEALAEKRAKYEALMAGCSSSAYGKDKSEEEEEGEEELVMEEQEEEVIEQEQSVVEVDANGSEKDE